MAGSLSGDFADAKFIHPFDTEDGDDVGPGAYTLKNGATIQATAKFGNALLCSASGHVLDSDSAVSNFDQSDTAKTMYHFWWRTPTLAGNQGQITWTNSGKSLFKTRIFWTSVGAKMRMEWTRSVDLSPGKPTICVDSIASLFSTDVFSSVSSYINASGTSEGKMFKDGVDITNAVVEEASPTRGTSGFDFLRLGNNFNALDPCRFLDHVTVIQSPTLSDAKATDIAFNYHDTQGSGYFPTFGSLSATSGVVGDAISLFGRGYGLDAVVKLDGVNVDSQVRIDQGQVDFLIPNVSPGVHNLSIKNVVANVTFTETAAFTVLLPPFTQLINATATDTRKVTATFDRAVNQVDPTNVDDALNPSNYSFRPVNTPEFTAVFTPTVITVSVVDTDTVELLMDDDLSYARDYEIEALNIESAGGESLDSTRRTFTFTSVDPRPAGRPREN